MLFTGFPYAFFVLNTKQFSETKTPEPLKILAFGAKGVSPLRNSAIFRVKGGGGLGGKDCRDSIPPTGQGQHCILQLKDDAVADVIL